MPSKDPKTGKPVGGAAKKRKKKVSVRAVKKAAPAAPKKGVIDIGPPPEDTAELVTWAAAALAKVVFRAAQGDVTFPTEVDRLRFIADGCAKIGLVRDKAAEQARLRKVAEAAGKLPSSKPKGAKPLAGIQKPDTARRA